MKKKVSFVVGNKVSIEGLTTTKKKEAGQEEHLFPVGVKIEAAASQSDVITTVVKPSFAALKQLAEEAIMNYRVDSEISHILEFTEKGVVKFSQKNIRTSETKTFETTWEWDSGTGTIFIDFLNMIQANTKTNEMENNEQHLLPPGVGSDSNEEQEQTLTRCKMISHIINNSAQWTEADLEQKETSFITNLYQSIAPVDFSLNNAGGGKANDDDGHLLPTSTKF